ncbi:hypothetical protein V8D89_007190 [Ganoderma adspersum]
MTDGPDIPVGDWYVDVQLWGQFLKLQRVKRDAGLRCWVEVRRVERMGVRGVCLAVAAAAGAAWLLNSQVLVILVTEVPERPNFTSRRLLEESTQADMPEQLQVVSHGTPGPPPRHSISHHSIAPDIPSPSPRPTLSYGPLASVLDVVFGDYFTTEESGEEDYDTVEDSEESLEGDYDTAEESMEEDYDTAGESMPEEEYDEAGPDRRGDGHGGRDLRDKPAPTMETENGSGPSWEEGDSPSESRHGRRDEEAAADKNDGVDTKGRMCCIPSAPPFRGHMAILLTRSLIRRDRPSAPLIVLLPER